MLIALGWRTKIDQTPDVLNDAIGEQGRWKAAGCTFFMFVMHFKRNYRVLIHRSWALMLTVLLVTPRQLWVTSASYILYPKCPRLLVLCVMKACVRVRVRDESRFLDNTDGLSGGL